MIRSSALRRNKPSFLGLPPKGFNDFRTGLNAFGMHMKKHVSYPVDPLIF